MNRPRVLGFAQELASVAWTLLAAWTLLPGGVGLEAVPIAALVAGAALICVLALLRRPPRLRGSSRGGSPAQARDNRHIVSH